MGSSGIFTQQEITEAIELAREAVEAVNADEESWFDRLMDAAARGFTSTDQTLHETYRVALFVMMQEIVRTRPIVLAARAEPRINETTSAALKSAVAYYEGDDPLPT